ncbi:carboxy terminal-processing peptidase [Peredibacter starrii]|uniref:Carboxy terminal-processing peptidase n=1 Tax=Peredibacter starrii TaxID=28202 RepID=A0AAX4HLD7_9BACT|nr:carboxy terminal-processing peptidase [Peredibacter starrii]WPU63983.1 carboxy terminal-processing peptidase [Peredibacter starrii]
MKSHVLLLSLALVTTGAVAQQKSSPMSSSDDPSILGSIMSQKPAYPREMILGSILLGALENMHLSNKKVDNQLSENAYKLYLERLDYGKQFLLDSDVKQLDVYKDKFDDMLKSGDLRILDTSAELMNKRIGQIEKYVETLLAKPLDYNTKEQLETDPKKRSFLKSENELFAHWEKLMKYEVLSRIIDQREEQNGLVLDDKGQKKKPKSEKKLTEVEIEKDAREKVLKSYKKIFSRLVNEKRSDKLDKFYNAITKVFDPHTNYLVPEEKEDFDIDMSGKLEGIGAILREENSYIKVERIVPGSASWKTKEIEAEDVILKVGQGKEEPVDVVDMSLRDAVKLIRGKKGSEVRLTIKKPNGLVKVVPIIRDVVEIEESYARGTVLELAPNKTKVGYINIPKFYRDFNDRAGRNVTDDTRREIERLNKEGVEGLIIDLRNNGGGALEDARMISGLFIEKGPIVQVKAHTGTVDILADTDPKVDFQKPVIVLINRFSASASEIVAAALQDYNRAVIVGGEFSHGKGTVQAVVDLDGYISPMAKSYSPLGALKITIQKFYRVNGSSTQYKGVTPDIILPDQFSHLESGEKFLDYSIPWGEVKPVKYTKWDKKYDLKSLRGNSQARVKKSEKFQHLQNSIKWYKEQKEKTKRSLVAADFEKERKSIREMTDVFKKEEESKNLMVKDLSPKSGEKAQQEKFEEFSKTLKKDAVIEESMMIMQDMLKQK